MDEPITITPIPKGELAELVEKAGEIFKENFGKEAWFGRCIFLSWYCERGTCTFCFRSVTKHKISHADKAKRSLASVVAEAMLIKGMNWRIEFLTGGYGIAQDDQIVRMTKLVSQVLKEKIWINLGDDMGEEILENMKPYVKGIVSSIETLEPKLHKQVCPDKPIQPFIEMMDIARSKEYILGMTIIVGLGENKEDFSLLKKFIEDNDIERITIYALRPVAGTPFEHGPDSLDVTWWIAKTRIEFPNIEIIVGSAIYRIPELSLFLKAGANAVTKLPATNLFNTQKGINIQKEFLIAERETDSIFTSEDVYAEQDWESMLDGVDVNDEEKEAILKALYNYLNSMKKKGKKLFNQEDEEEVEKSKKEEKKKD